MYIHHRVVLEMVAKNPLWGTSYVKGVLYLVDCINEKWERSNTLQVISNWPPS